MVGVFRASLEAAPGSFLGMAGGAGGATFMPCGIGGADGGARLAAADSAGAALGGRDDRPAAHASMAPAGQRLHVQPRVNQLCGWGRQPVRCLSRGQKLTTFI